MATKILEYTFDKTIGDCLPYLEPTSIAMTKSDTGSGNIITRTISVDTMPTKINFYNSQNRNALKSVTYVNISSVKSLRDFCNTCSNVESILIENQTAPNLNDMWAFAKNSPKLTSVKLLNVTSPNPIEFSGAFCENKTLTEIVITGKLKPASMYQSFLKFQGTTLDLTSIDISECTSLYQCFYNCANLETIDLSTWKTNKVTTMADMFNACYKLKSLDLNNLDISNVKYMSTMFYNCGSLEELNIQNWDTLNVLTFGSMFALCKSLPSSFWDLTWMNVSSATDIGGMFRGLNLTSTDEINISNWNTSNVVSMESMFQDCKYITKIDISFLNTSKLNNISSMFKNCNALTDINISTFDLSRCSSFYELCWNCGKLKSLDFLKGLDISGVTSWVRAFNGCYELTDISVLKDMKFVYRTSLMQVLEGCRKIENWEVLSTWDVTGVYHFGGAFASTNIDSLSYMKDWNMSNAENIAGMFNNNSIITSLEPIRNWNTSNVNNMNGLCSNIKKLTSLEPIKNWDTSKVTDMSNAFSNGVGENLEFDLNWDMSNVTNMGDMFLNSKFKKINLSNKNLSKVTSFYRTFYNCTVTEEIDLSGIVATSAVNTSFMFCNCYKLRYLDLSSFSGELITNITAMFENTKLETIDLSNMRVDKLSSTDCWNKAGSSDKTLAFLYVDATNINKFINNYKTRFPNSRLTIYYHEANPSDLVVKDGVTYIKYNTPNSMQIPNKEMYSFPDGTRDELDVKTGVLTRRVGKFVLDGSFVDSWRVAINSGNTVLERSLATGEPNLLTLMNNYGFPKTLNKDNSMTSIPIDTSLVDINVSSKKCPSLCMDSYFGNYFIRISIPNGVVNDVVNDKDQYGYSHNDANRWLNENPITIVYKLSTPTTEKLILNHNHSCEYGMVLPTGAVDYYNLVTKEYSQNISSINLTGEDVWDESTEYENTVRFLYVSHTDIKMKASGGLYCDNDLFPNIQDDSDVEHCRVHETDDNKLYIFINKDRLMSPDLIGWQIWLQENPFNVYYERTETLTVIREYEELDTQLARWEMIDCYDNGTIDIENNDINTRIYSDLSYDCKSINNFEIKSLLPNETYTVYADNMMDNPTIYLGGNTHSFTSNRPYLSGDDKWVRFYTYTISKNLYNKENYLKAWIDEWGQIRYGDNDILCDYVSIKPSTNYTYRVYSPVDHNTRFGWYDADKNFIKRVNSDSCNAGNVTFQSPSNAYYVRVSSSNMISMGYDANIGLYEGGTTPDIFEPYQKKLYTYDATNLMIIKGDISNEVVPYFTGINSVVNPTIQSTSNTNNSTVTTNVILRSSESGVKDSYNVLTGELIQRVGENLQVLETPIKTTLESQELLAYEDGQILLSSESGLIPTLTYSVPSTNTFHLPSMKTGTRYTLKYPSASGNIAIGNIKYNINSPSMLFTTPLTIIGDTSAIVFSDENPQDVMLIEGAYNTREIPLFTGVKSVVNPTINIIDNGTEESRTYRCQEEIELRSLPNGVADKLDIVGGKLTRAVGIRPYQEGDEDLPNTLTDGYNTIYQLSKPTVSSVTFVTPVVTSDSTMHLSSEALIPQLNYRVPSNNNFPLDLLEPNKTYTLYANTLVSGSYTLGGTHNGYFTGTEVIALGDVTNNLLTFDGDLGLSDVVLIKGNSMNSELPYFEGLKTVENATITIASMQGEENSIILDDSITLRACGDIKDTIDMVNLVMTQRLSEIALKGTEPWSLITTNESINDEYVLFGLVIGGIKSSVATSLVCDKFNHKYQSGEMHNQEGIYAVNNQLRICVKKTTIGGETVDAIKTWLGQNNTRVIYALINPIEYQLQNSWTSTPPTSYNNRTTISSQVVDSLKPMITVTIATTTLEQIVNDLQVKNEMLAEENEATMMALTEVYEMMFVGDEASVTTLGLDEEIEPVPISSIGMVYVKLIKKGLKTIDQVPSFLLNEVKYGLQMGK